MRFNPRVRMVNLGCGQQYHPDWVNIDISARGPGVISHDLSKSVPLADESVDVIYHSAVLEHFRRCDALKFLLECKRILTPAGTIRIGVPDLQRICELYLLKLDAALKGDRQAALDREWMVLEMLDQTVREQSGGEMLAYLRQTQLDNEEFVYSRIGEEGRQLVASLRREARPAEIAEQFMARSSEGPRQWAARIRRSFHRRLLELLLGHEGLRALEIGRFRLAGEVHQWMYDQYSLSVMLLDAGFQSPVRQDSTTSQIPNWTRFNLDSLVDGTVIKPDLFFMEATKPGGKSQ